MIKKILISTLLMISAISWAENPDLEYSTDTIEGIVLYRYPVEKSVGLYRVSVNFSVPQSTIIEWNPFLKERGLQFGDTLYIPTGRPIVIERPAAPEGPIEAIAAIDTIEAIETIETIDTIAPDTTTAAMRVALLLPMQAQSVQRTETMDRFLDFYEGCLIGLKDRQDSANRVELYLYDTGKEPDILSRLMGNELIGMNAIIGPAYPQQVAMMDTFALSHQIPTLIPFINDDNSPRENPYLYYFNTTSQMDADTFLTYLTRRGELTNCVLVEGREEDIPKDIRYIREQIEARSLPHTTTSLHAVLTDSIFTALRTDVENIVIFNTTKFANVQILLPHLISGKGDRRVSLFSLYAWQKERIVMPQVYTTLFSTDSIPPLAQYEADYTTYFGHKHASLVPRYDLLGYDIIRQFLDVIEGKNPSPGLQSDIQFQQQGTGSWVNTHIRLIHK